MPEKIGVLTISATPQQSSSTNEPWENADFIKNTLIPKLLTIHKHLVITIADGTLQAHNFEAFYPLQGYSELDRTDAITKANAVGGVIYDDLTEAVQQHTLWQGRITILRWDDINIAQEKLLVNKKLDSENTEYDSYLVKSIKTVVEARVKFLNNQNVLSATQQDKIRAQSTQYFIDEVAHAYKILAGILLSINDEDVVCQPETVWYPGVVPDAHPIPYVFKVGETSIFHRINQKGNVDEVIKRVAKKLSDLRETEQRVEYITLLKETQEVQAYLLMLTTEIMKKDTQESGSRESAILAFNAHSFLAQAKEYLKQLVGQPAAVTEVFSTSPTNTVIASTQGTAATVNSNNAAPKVPPLFQNLSTTTRKLSNSSSTGVI